MTEYVKTISEVMAELKAHRGGTRMVRDWKSMLPPGSRWNPNDPGDPACKTCEGTGYLRIGDLPIGHPYFGKIVLCDCTKSRVKQMRPMPKEIDIPEEPPFMDELQQEEQAAFDTGEAFRQFAERKRVK